jgi:two-component system alkaline phosphatase synthesis response regulator PhoP
MKTCRPIANFQPSYQDAHLSIDFHQRMVTVDSKPLTFTRKEYELLSFLVTHAGEIVPRETLLKSVWGYCDGVRTRTLDMHLSLLRKKLRPYSGQYIERVFRMGCRFQPCPAAKLECATNVA